MGGGYWAVRTIPTLFVTSETEVATAVAKIMDLRDVIVEQGTLESQNTINGICQIRGYENKIISLVPEGTKVKKGDVVVKFDDANILKEMESQRLEITEAQSDLEDAKQEVTVQVNENQSETRAAKQALEFAKIDLNKYLEGDFLVSKADQEGSISEAETEVKKRQRELEAMRVYVKRGFRQYEQLREAQQSLQSAELRLKRDKQKYDMLLRFDHVKQKAELEGKLTEAKFKLDAVKETAKAKLAKAEDKLDYRERRLKMKKETLTRMQENHKKFVIEAPQDGTVAFPPSDMFGRENQIREGGVVYQNQVVFFLPNMRQMQVKVDVHESMVSKVKVGQKVVVRVDAFQNYPLEGVVTKVATLAQNSYFTTAKNYKAIIKIDDIPEDIALKPGMTAKSEIVCGVYRDVLCVPVQAITTKFGKTFAYVRNREGFERREVTIDRNNISFIEVVKGLEPGDEVALDAYERSIEDFEGVEAEELAVKATESAPESGAKQKPSEPGNEKPESEKSEAKKSDPKNEPDVGKSLNGQGDANNSESPGGEAPADIVPTSEEAAQSSKTDSITKSKAAKESAKDESGSSGNEPRGGNQRASEDKPASETKPASIQGSTEKNSESKDDSKSSNSDSTTVPSSQNSSVGSNATLQGQG